MAMAINGIEMIARRILQDAQSEADGIARVAEENSRKVAAQYDKQARDAETAVLEAAEKDCADLIRRMKGEADMQARSDLLSEKQALVQKAFSMAREEILDMEDERYLDFLANLACRASVSGKEQIVLNEKDRQRFGAELAGRVNEALSTAGKPCGLVLSEETAPIEGGLLLRDGSVETNCSIGILMKSGRDALAPAVASMLFS